MSRVDQFESVFRSATREPFAYEPVEIARVLVVTDLAPQPASEFTERVRNYLTAIDPGSSGGSRAVEWIEITGGQYSNVQSLLDLVDDRAPDLICTYRNLGNEAWQFGHTLGDHLEVLTQATTVPVLVLPHPVSSGPTTSGQTENAGRAMDSTRAVMAITDHLAGDDRLVNMAAHFTADGGHLFLTHVEDQVQFERYIDAVSKIPEIDTDIARKKIMERLLKGPTDFIDSCRDALAGTSHKVEVHDIVALGHRLGEYEKLIESHDVDLLVFHTKDDDQLAMHGLAYPLAVELRQIPLLMI